METRKTPDQLEKQGDELFAKEQYHQAYECYAEAGKIVLAHDRDRLMRIKNKADINLGMHYLKRNMYKNAGSCFSAVKPEEGYFSEKKLLQLRSFINIKLNKWYDAAADLGLLLEHYKKCGDMPAKERDKLIKEAEVAIETCHFNLASYYECQGKYDHAVEHYNYLLNLNNERAARYYYLRGCVHKKTNNHEQAFADFTQCLLTIAGKKEFDDVLLQLRSDCFRQRAKLNFEAKSYADAVLDYARVTHHLINEKKYVDFRPHISHGKVSLKDILNAIARQPVNDQIDLLELSLNPENSLGHRFANKDILEDDYREQIRDYLQHLNSFNIPPTSLTRSSLFAIARRVDFGVIVNDPACELESYKQKL